MLNILLKVRSFYLDLQSWAYGTGPVGRWVAPCPVQETEVRRARLARRRINERSADRTRARQPLLPLLVTDVRDRREYLPRLLAAAPTPPRTRRSRSTVAAHLQRTTRENGARRRR